MAVFEASAENPLGLHPGKMDRVRVKVRGGTDLSKGMVCRFDLAASDTGSVVASTAFGGATGPTSNVLQATADHDGDETGSVIWLYCVLLEDIADDCEGWACIRGVVQALGGATVAAGVGLATTAGGELLHSPTNTRIIGISLEALSNATLGWVAFNGIEGWGCYSATSAP
jgi:hypothetical protein